jgi:hypothetical protein
MMKLLAAQAPASVPQNRRYKINVVVNDYAVYYAIFSFFYGIQ